MGLIARVGRAMEQLGKGEFAFPFPRGNLAKVAEPTGALAEIANRSCQADPFALRPFALRPHSGRYAAVTTILASRRESGLVRITISTSWSRAVRKCMRRSTEKPSSR